VSGDAVFSRGKREGIESNSYSTWCKGIGPNAWQNMLAQGATSKPHLRYKPATVDDSVEVSVCGEERPFSGKNPSVPTIRIPGVKTKKPSMSR
jgi:hypothetical protein